VNNCEIKGLLAIDGKLNLNSNKIILTNSNLDISYLSGYIFSETNPSEGLGEVQIKVGNTENTYNIPFGSGDNENDLMLTFSVVSAGNPSDATVTFATYPTSEKNQPFPPNISNLNTFLANKTINRFWEIAPNFSSNPNFSINLSYTDNDINNNDNIVEENLGIIRYNNSKNIWDDKTINTIINTTNNTASSEVISSNDFFNFWTLTEKIETPAEFNIPNGITPNNDGFNDTWIIEDLPENTKVKIFNRWGDKVFSSDNYLGEWDGGDLPSGAYYYIIILSDGTKYKGDVNILK
jgi:gliding motility-associated-like protein